ncbi:MAG: bifunctional (p)ppGpp synthetase/guanosine-3',5'-bis(diphosphate) 3'-pyrophosphohydrolase [Elusimicrobia bacterium]|nr:bifunctional (p)ppGpp synthetase/guanosine-3',5'-bis(diphosphate) 3'-pyrophosphohydrolase [Elusimicrobiota bacterium]
MNIKSYVAANPSFKSQVENALLFAEKNLAGLKRSSGRTYYQHALGVAENLAELNFDPLAVISGILHDILEDTKIEKENIQKQFGNEIANIVEGVTKIKKFTSILSDNDRHGENIRKLIIATAKDIRVIFVKLADRLDNLMDLKYLPRDRIIRMANETLDIYAPIAHRLGVYTLKAKLEDYAFMNLEPELFKELSVKINEREAEQQETLNNIVRILRKNLEPLNVYLRISARPKNIYSISRKMKKQNKPFEEIQDILGIRIITDTVESCYSILSKLNDIFQPVTGSFTDYIAHPKPNMYRSIHTTVKIPENHIIEIQIRTEEMHRIASYGIAAHWKYKESSKAGGNKSRDFDEKISWLASIIEWQGSSSSKEFIAGLKTELEFNQVFVFTPEGDIKSLPVGSTPVDFAYKVHTDIGNHCHGAKVNNKMVTLKYNLLNGDTVEILTSKNAHPSQDWLKFVKTPLARTKIKNYDKSKKK